MSPSLVNADVSPHYFCQEQCLGVPLGPPCDRVSTSPVATWLSGPLSTTEASGWGCPLGRTRSRPHSEGAWEPQLVAVSKHR